MRPNEHITSQQNLLNQPGWLARSRTAIGAFLLASSGCTYLSPEAKSKLDRVCSEDQNSLMPIADKEGAYHIDCNKREAYGERYYTVGEYEHGVAIAVRNVLRFSQLSLHSGGIMDSVVIDRHGKVLTGSFDYTESYSTDFVRVVKSQKSKDFIFRDGELVAVYDSIYQLDDDKFCAEVGDNSFALDGKGTATNQTFEGDCTSVAFCETTDLTFLCPKADLP